MADDEDGEKGNGSDKGPPSTLEAALAKISDLERKVGSMVNDNKKLKDKATLVDKMKGWMDIEGGGHTPEEVHALLSRQQEEDLARAKKEGDVTVLLDNQRKKHEKDQASLEAKYLAEKAVNDRVLIDSVLRMELGKICETKLVAGAFALLRGKAKMIEDPDVEYGRQAVFEFGDNAMTVEDYIKQWAESDEAEPYLKATLAAGGGAIGARGAAARLRLKARKDMSPSEKSQYIRAHGYEEYMKLPMDRA